MQIKKELLSLANATKEAEKIRGEGDAQLQQHMQVHTIKILNFMILQEVLN